MNTTQLSHTAQFIVYLMLVLSCQAFSSEYESLTKQNSTQASNVVLTNDAVKNLPQDKSIDNQGNVLDADLSQVALEYRAEEAKNRYYRLSSQGEKTKTTKKQKKQQTKAALGSTKTANDASCRWLKNRIKHLNKQIKPNINHQQHLENELSIRQDEWQCLQCGGAGPKPTDYHQCQYRR